MASLISSMPDSDLDMQNLFRKIKEQIQRDSPSIIKPHIPSIIEFIYSKRYLNFQDRGITLYPMQTLILKCFYRGQLGNENLKLTDEELQLLEKEHLDQVLEKYNSGDIFRELVLVLGRRAGKDFLSGIIAAYEAMRLLELPGGDPNKYYGIAGGNPIYILTIATSSDQAKVLFNEIKHNTIQSEYFIDKIGAMEADRIWLLTPADRIHNRRIVEDTMNSHGITKGSVVVMSGHSNSDSLLGKGFQIIIFDEVASYKSTGGSASGERLYSALGPGTVAFKRPILDENGEQSYDENGVAKYRLESKIISISSPRGEEGILFKLYQNAGAVKDRLAFRLSTWKVNASISYEMLRSQNQYMSSADFAMEFGAEFAGTAGEKFIPDKYVDQAIDMGRELGLDQRNLGTPGMVYYAHLDPASTSHNYALAIIHVEERVRMIEKENGRRIKEKYKLFVVDHLKQWQPSVNRAINVDDVDQYIIDLARRFRFAMVSYDTWNSKASIVKLRAKGIPSKEVQFRKAYKMFIYSHLEDLLIKNQIALPHKGVHAQDLEMELKCLKRVFTNQGFKIGPDPEAVKTTDDLCVSPTTMIYCKNGTKIIAEVKKGDYILTHQGRYCEVKEVSKHTTCKQGYVIQPYYGFKLHATSSHPLEVWCNSERIWRNVIDIKISDLLIRSWDASENKLKYDLKDFTIESESPLHRCEYIRTDSIRSQNPNAKWINRFINNSLDFGYLAGLYLAEGNIADHGVAFASNIDHHEIHANLSKTCMSVIGIEPTKPFQPDPRDKSSQSTINSTILRDFFISLFGHRLASEKIIPYDLLSAPIEFQKSLLRGYFDGDGSFDARDITFTSTSESLLLGLQIILLRMRIVSSFSINRRKGKFTFIRGRKVYYRHDLLNLRICDYESHSKLAEILNLPQKNKSKFHKPKYVFINDNSIAFQIRKIQQKDITEVVNIKVDGDSSFVAGSINTHNCDAVSGACGMATENLYSGYPQGATVYMPQIRGAGGGQQWRIGYGTYEHQQWKNIHQMFGKM